MNTTRIKFEIKHEGREQVFALTDTREDAELLCERLNRKEGGRYYVREKAVS